MVMSNEQQPRCPEPARCECPNCNPDLSGVLDTLDRWLDTIDGVEQFKFSYTTKNKLRVTLSVGLESEGTGDGK
jgi:hypothetical protein